MKTQTAEKLLQNLTIIIGKYCNIYNKLIDKQTKGLNLPNDPLQLNKLFFKLCNNIFNDPDRLLKYQMSFFKGQFEAIESICQQYYQSIPNIYENSDKRFKHDLWHEHCAFAWIKQAYYTYSTWIESLIDDLPKNDFTKLELRRLNFIIKQFIDAIAPTNFPLTNPDVMQTFLDTAGESFIKGLDNLMRDIENSKAGINIKNNDDSNFALGLNIAVTKGYVVYQNNVMQLIHYKPQTSTQYSLPILIVPPFINKYYILDLQAENSFVKWLLENNYNVFMISWINPDESLADLNFEDYMLNGPIESVDYICKTLNIDKVNTIGYCIGGTLLSCSVAYMKAQNDNRIATATLLTTLIDFKEAGDLSIFVDDHFIDQMERYMDISGGYLDGNDMAHSFNLLKSNDMIWPFYINNYLLGKEPFPFGLLYWNSDGTRMPKALHLFYLKNMYRDNLLTIPNAIKLNNQAIDISKIDIPCFVVAAKNDHIVPWKNAFKSAKLFSGDVTFILSDSGHIAGIVNHPAANKYCYWLDDDFLKTDSNEKWLGNAKMHSGSWWPNFNDWLQKYSGTLIQAEQVETIHSTIIETAPGSYVKVR